MDSKRQSNPTVRVSDWKPHGVRMCLAASSRNFVGLMEDGCTVLKYPHQRTQNAMEALQEEAARYERLHPHNNLVTFKGHHRDGLLFEYCERGPLYDVIRFDSIPMTDDQKSAIGTQITQCLIHLHKQNFIHCDLNVNNVFLTSEMQVKVGDIQGQLYRADGTIEMPTMSQENAKSRHPQAGDDEFSPRTDIFALGTLLYYLWCEHEPFPELDEYTQVEEIESRYRRREFPIEISHATGIDRIIAKCWNSKYESATEVLEDMDRLSEGRSKLTPKSRRVLAQSPYGARILDPLPALQDRQLRT